MRTIIILIFICFATHVQAQVVSDAKFEQVVNEVHITYNLSENTNNIKIYFSNDAGVSFKPIYHVRGDVGFNVSKGHKRIIWDALKEGEELKGSSFAFRIHAEPAFTELKMRKKVAKKHNYFNFKLGVKVGLNMSNIVHKEDDVADDYKYTSLTDWSSAVVTGIYIDLDLTKSLGLQIEMLYTKQSTASQYFDYDDNDDFLYIDNEMQFHYFQLPILLKLGIRSRSNGFYSIYAGPQFGYIFSTKFLKEGKSQGKIDADEFNNFDVSLAFGFMLQFGFGMDMDLRYTFGLNELQPDIEARFQTIQMSLGWRF